MNEWMNEWRTYIALYCVLLYTQSALQSWGGLFSTTTSVQHPLGWCDGSHRTTAPVRSPHTSYRWRGERVIEPIKWIGIIRRPWLTRASEGNFARTPGLHPYSLRWVSWDRLIYWDTVHWLNGQLLCTLWCFCPFVLFRAYCISHKKNCKIKINK